LFYRVWLGHIEYDAAIRSGAVAVDGRPALAKQLPRWLMWSPMAGFVRDRERTLAQTAGNERHPTLGSATLVLHVLEGK
jgi:hypothetical protein